MNEGGDEREDEDDEQEKIAVGVHGRETGGWCWTGGSVVLALILSDGCGGVVAIRPPRRMVIMENFVAGTRGGGFVETDRPDALPVLEVAGLKSLRAAARAFVGDFDVKLERAPRLIDTV